MRMLLRGVMLLLRLASWLTFFAWLALLDNVEELLRGVLGAVGRYLVDLPGALTFRGSTGSIAVS